MSRPADHRRTAASTRAILAPLAGASRLGFRRTASEPGGLLFVAVFYLMVTSVLGGLWHTAALARGGDIVGYGAVSLIWYIAAAEAAVNALPFRLIEDIGTDIESGQLETELLRPVPPLGLRVAGEIGRMLPRIGVCAAVGTAFSLVVGGPPEHLGALLLAGPSLVLAATVNLLAQHTFAGTGFWLRDVRSAWFLYQKLVFVMGGMLLPLQVLPHWLEVVARVLPFSAMAYAPARLASGHLEPGLLIIQTAWLGVVGLAARQVYRSGERRLMGAGA